MYTRSILHKKIVEARTSAYEKFESNPYHTYPKLITTSTLRTKKTTNGALIYKVSGITRCKNKNLISIAKREKHI